MHGFVCRGYMYPRVTHTVTLMNNKTSWACYSCRRLFTENLPWKLDITCVQLYNCREDFLSPCCSSRSIPCAILPFYIPLFSLLVSLLQLSLSLVRIVGRRTIVAQKGPPKPEPCGKTAIRAGESYNRAMQLAKGKCRPNILTTCHLLARCCRACLITSAFTICAKFSRDTGEKKLVR